MLSITPTAEDLATEHRRLTETLSERRHLARGFIRRDCWPFDQSIQEYICDEHEHQREVVGKFGQCEGGCSNRNLRKHENGQVVCRWTHQACPRTELAELIEFLSILNGRNDE